ncbi:MAG TPA: FecR domain-containing protein [Candidatus Dormibacteraeota bacterium]|nr:FecR domain-containing protein [Candidatus Dormibacteraeota bacterium]
MKRLALLLVASLLVVGQPAFASTINQLENLHGNVSYERGSAKAQQLPQRTAVALTNNDFALTGFKSLAGITLPDSSRIEMGSSTRVQLSYFRQSTIAHAKFLVYQGKVRFRIEHPKGARADYVFQTPSAQMAVRGTFGDFLVAPNKLVVNVYAVSNPNLPVEVIFNNGKTVFLGAGKSLVATFTGTSAAVSVGSVSRQSLSNFSEFTTPKGVPGVLSSSSVGTATATTTTAAVVGGTAVTTAVSGTKSGTPPSTPAPQVSATPTVTIPIGSLNCSTPPPSAPGTPNAQPTPCGSQPVAPPGRPPMKAFLGYGALFALGLLGRRLRK